MGGVRGGGVQLAGGGAGRPAEGPNAGRPASPIPSRDRRVRPPQHGVCHGVMLPVPQYSIAGPPHPNVHYTSVVWWTRDRGL